MSVSIIATTMHIHPEPVRMNQILRLELAGIMGMQPTAISLLGRWFITQLALAR